jgi:hypothetical protein
MTYSLSRQQNDGINDETDIDNCSYNPIDIFGIDEYSSEATAKAMEAARQCEANGLSPGAGLPTAEEQAEV